MHSLQCAGTHSLPCAGTLSDSSLCRAQAHTLTTALESESLSPLAQRAPPSPSRFKYIYYESHGLFSEMVASCAPWARVGLLLRPHLGVGSALCPALTWVLVALSAPPPLAQVAVRKCRSVTAGRRGVEVVGRKRNHMLPCKHVAAQSSKRGIPSE